LNETATSQTPGVFLGEHRLLYDGPLEDLDWHQHSFACVLVGMDGDIEIERRGDEGCVRSRVVLAGPAVEHRLRFDTTRVLTCYIPPHEPDFAALRWVQGEEAAAEWDGQWGAAVRLWGDERGAGGP
jgi:hypothetical protein